MDKALFIDVVPEEGRVTVCAVATHYGLKADTSAVDGALEEYILTSSGRSQKEVMISKTSSD